MLGLLSMIDNPDDINKEVQDPVSGNYYPMSLNDMHAQRAQVKLNKQEQKFASMLASIVK